MTPNSKRAFIVSLVLHGAIFVFLLLGVIINWFRDKPEPHVFHLQAAPAPSRQSARLPEIDIPDLSFDVETPQPVQPIPEVKEPPPPQSTPTPPPPKPVSKPKPTPAPEPPPKPMSYEDFVKQQGAPTAPKPKTKPRKTVTVQKIDISDIRAALAESLSSEVERERVSRMSASDQQAVYDYLGNVKSLLNTAFRKPSGLSSPGLYAKVRFKVSSSGQIYALEFVRSSGNEIFDEAVRDAFARVGSAGPTPNGGSYTPSLTFTLKE